MCETAYGDGPYNTMFMKQRSQSLQIVTATCQLLEKLRSLGVNDEAAAVEAYLGNKEEATAALAGLVDVTDARLHEAIAQAASRAYGHFPNMDANFSPDDAWLVLELARDSRHVLTNVALGRLEEAVGDINTFFRDRPLIVYITSTPPWPVHNPVKGH